MDDFLFIRLLKSILFTEFYCTFSISYEILRYYYYWCGSDRPSGLPYSFVPALLLSILTVIFLVLRLFLYLISFLLFPCASVWVNTCA